MARAVLRQPDGNWCVFSSICDDFIIVDATMGELREWLYEEAMEKERRLIDSWLRDAEQDIHRGFGPSTYEEAVELRDEIHGEYKE